MPAKPEVKLTEEIARAAQVLLKKSGEITAILPDTMSTDKINQSVEAVALTLGNGERRDARLKPMIGRLLVLAKANPDVYSAFDNYEEYKTKGVCQRYGLSRTTIQDAKRMIEKFPSLDMDDYEDAGVTNMLILCGLTSQAETGYKKILTQAKKLTTEEFKEWLVANDYIEKGELDGANIKIPGPKNKIKEIYEFFDNPAVHAKVGSEKYIDILLALTQECANEWEIAGNAAIDEAKAVA